MLDQSPTTAQEPCGCLKELTVRSKALVEVNTNLEEIDSSLQRVHSLYAMARIDVAIGGTQNIAGIRKIITDLETERTKALLMMHSLHKLLIDQRARVDACAICTPPTSRDYTYVPPGPSITQDAD
jgi:hypothetical protein